MQDISLKLFVPPLRNEKHEQRRISPRKQKGVIEVLSEDEPVKHLDIIIASI